MGAVDMLKSIDFLGKPYNVIFEHQSRSKTWLGCTFTFLLFGIFVSSVIVFGREILDYSQPKAHSTQVFSYDSQLMQWDMPVIFTVATTDGVMMANDEFLSNFEITAEFTTISIQGNKLKVDRKPLAVEDCSANNLSPIDFKYYQDFYRGTSHYCLNPKFYLDKEGNKIPIEAYYRNNYGHIDSAYVRFSFKICDEKEKPGCANQFRQLGSFYINRLLYLSYFDLNDYNNPVRRYSRNMPTLVTPNMFVRNFTRLTINTLFTDRGWVFKDQSSETFFTLDREYQFIKLYDEETRDLASFFYEVSFLQNEYFRSYIKLQELLANIGGFMKTCLLISNAVVYFYSDFVFFNRFRSIIDLKKGTKQTNNTLRREGDLSSSNVNMVKKKRRRRQVGFWEYCLSFVSKKKDVENGVLKWEYLKYTDLGFIASKIIEFEQQKEEKIEDPQVSRFQVRRKNKN